MTWHVTGDVDAFRTAAGEHLAADPARNTVLLTVSEGARRAPVDGARYGWWTEPDGRVTGAFLVTPPHPPALGPMPDRAARALARELPDATGARGEYAPAHAFAEAMGQNWTTARRMRLFRLGTLTPPHPSPPGRARAAVTADVPLALDWMRGFAADIGEDPDADYAPNIEARVADGRLHLWETDDGPVAMASISPLVADQARLSPVYTPPPWRGRGFGGAVTSAVSRAALDAGARQVLLFTDLANPTSNALYQRLGYRPLVDHVALTTTHTPRHT
ncbi:GNAT family N-acetyltransferase [Streptomyces purpureus]|uniref:GNAT family N-acetyltransferase n=1 Tax=Streptomyces purpureus TaxID=1951 RepID=UPI0037B6A783